MKREIDILTATPESISRVTCSLRRMGARAHRGGSGETYAIGEEVFSWKDRFAAGVTRVDTSGNTVATPRRNKGGYPVIDNSRGKEILVAHTKHTHIRTDYRADGVPVNTTSFKNSADDDEHEDDLVGL